MEEVTSVIKVVDADGDIIIGALVSITNISGTPGGKTGKDGTITIETPKIDGINIKATRYGNSAFQRVKPGGKITIMID